MSLGTCPCVGPCTCIEPDTGIPLVNESGSSIYGPTSILCYGADPTGTNSSSSAFLSAFAALHNFGTVFIPGGLFTLQTPVSVPAGITLQFAGGVIALAAGSSLTINGGLLAPAQKIFSWAGNSSPTVQPVTFGKGNKVGPIRPQWFGALGNGIADSSAAVTVCFNSAPYGGSFYFSAGNYLVTGPFNFGAVPVTIYGDGAMVDSKGIDNTLADWYAVMSGTWLVFQGANDGFQITSGNTNRLGLKSIGLLGSGTSSGTAINSPAASGDQSFYDICVANWVTGFIWTSEDSNFYNTRITGCNTGFLMTGGTINCFYGIDIEICTVGFDATNSALTSIIGGTIQGCTTALKIVPSASDTADELYFKNIWLEDNTTAVLIDTSATSSAVTMVAFDGVRSSGDPDTFTITRGSGTINGLSFKDCYFSTSLTIPSGVDCTWINSIATGTFTPNATTVIIDGTGFVATGSALPLVSQANITSESVGHIVGRFTRAPSISNIATGWGTGSSGTFTENLADLAGRGGIQNIPNAGTSTITAGNRLFTVNLGTPFSSNQFIILVQAGDAGSASQAPSPIYAFATSDAAFDVYSTGTVTPSSSADGGFFVVQWIVMGVTGSNT